MTGWIEGYRRSLKPLEVEEPVDLLLHRPLGYLVARLLLPTPVSPNVVTLLSILAGLAATACAVVPFEGHYVAAGGCVLLSAVLDCADGQLARMRGTSSLFGRMLDGVADLVVITAVIAAGAWQLWVRYFEQPWLLLSLYTLAAGTIATGQVHTSMYDHYKNVFLRFTQPGQGEGEDYDTAVARQSTHPEPASFTHRLAAGIYLAYLKGQAKLLARSDPATARISDLPGYSPDNARIYRRHAGALMWHWRNWFGFGSLVFGMGACIAIDIVEYYLAARFILLNALYYGYLRGRQHRASRAALNEMGAVAH